VPNRAPQVISNRERLAFIFRKAAQINKLRIHDPIFGPFGLMHQIGSVEYSCTRRFRAKLAQWLRTIRLIWPECPARISADGLYLVVNHAISVHPVKCPAGATV
jgi:hypothetical protein